MAKQKHSGPNSAANPQHEVPREGMAGQERAWLAGLAWLNGLTPAERDAALATAATPAQTPYAEATPSRARPPKVKIDHDDAEFGCAWFAALSPDQRGACIDWFNSQGKPLVALPADAPAPAPDPLSFTPDAERLSLALDAVYQVEALMNALVDITAKMVAGDVTGSEDLAIRSIAIRTRDLACTVMSTQEAAADLDEVHRTVHGTQRAEGAAA